MSLLGKIGTAARYHLWDPLLFFLVFFIFYFSYFFSPFCPLPYQLRLERAPGELAESSHLGTPEWGNSLSWFSGEKFKNTTTGTGLPSWPPHVFFHVYRTAFSSLAECGAPAAPSLTMRDFQSGVISLPETQLPIL